MKINRDKWQTDFERQLDIGEKKQIAIVKRYYKKEYNKGIESFISEGQTNFQLLFDDKDFLKIYRDIYSDIGMRFANWYAKGFNRYIKKGVNPNEYASQWQNTFASYGSAVGAQRVTLVKGTAKKTLVDITQRLMRDPDFMVLGNAEKSRILKNQFNRYSTFQAKRLVQTESTAAANFATMESATTIFPGAQMQKEWIASFDDRTRPTHSEAGASEPVPFNEPFMVGGSLMMFPGDPSGPAAEVINCRCSMAPFPKQGAQAVSEITDISFGLGGAQNTGFGLTDVVANINAAITGANLIDDANVIKNKIDEILLNNPNVPKNIVDLIDDFDGFDLTIFDHFKKLQKLNIKKVLANHQGGIVSMNKKMLPQLTNRTYIHESGHFVADSRGWIFRGIFRGEKDRAAKPLEEIFSKWKKIVLNKSNLKKYYDELNTLNYNSFETLGKKLGYTNSRVFLDDIGAVKDTFGALTKERIGGGHGVSYYKKVSNQWHEFIAHSYENRFQGNKLFKTLYPEMYKDMIKMVDELNLKY